MASISTDIVFDIRVPFTTPNATRPTSSFLHITTWPRYDRVIFPLARSHEYFTKGVSLVVAISGRNGFPRVYESRIEHSVDLVIVFLLRKAS